MGSMEHYSLIFGYSIAEKNCFEFLVSLILNAECAHQN